MRLGAVALTPTHTFPQFLLSSSAGISLHKMCRKLNPTKAFYFEMVFFSSLFSSLVCFPRCARTRNRLTDTCVEALCVTREERSQKESIYIIQNIELMIAYSTAVHK